MKRSLADAVCAAALLAGALAFSAPAQDEPDASAEVGAEESSVDVAAEELDEAAPSEQADDEEGSGDFPAPAPSGPALETDEAALEAINQYLNGIDEVQARFVQIGPDGAMAEGDLFIDRPGRARFEYDPPHPSIVVADGREVAHQDRDLETIDRVPLRSTPLRYLLQREIAIEDDAEIVSIARQPGEIALTARDPEGEMEGELTLVFATPVLELREWIVLDALGQQTVISLSGFTRGGDFDDDLFELEDDRRPSRRRNR